MDEFERTVECGLVVARVVQLAGRRRVRELLGFDEVDSAHVSGIETEFCCEHVDDPFEIDGCLWPTSTPVGVDRRRVGGG